MGQIHSVSKSPEERPAMGEVMEKIVNANEEFSISSMGSIYYPVHQSGAYFTLSDLRLGILRAQISDHGRHFFDPVLGAFSLSFFSLFSPFFLIWSSGFYVRRHLNRMI
ncbi:hypothetical protein NC653_027647 [Populus alba x Populus x berolinensis]|uniref:Uncharacterized protein n=1 Tax=Populus alba x Populus x berolinensis TaxID=444605 RepID=A0AAD6Q6F4_9ROSI|nr:hypothetical protein NC653_027647 [Populus alba x Populus x berolinensis]